MSSPAFNALQKVAKSSTARKLLIGRSWASKVPNAARILVRTMEFDKNLKMYFTRQDYYFAHDPETKCKTGDFVLIEQLPEQLTRDITHQVLKVVYQCGDVTDPISGKKCVGNEYRDAMDWEDELWGKNPSAFDYNKAPPRGWQEGRKDWSHKPGYRKWHDFVDKDQPEAVVPF